MSRHKPEKRDEAVGLVLQGGGALGAYQAGAYEALAERGETPEFVTGISIGAINAAIIAGNAPDERVARLRDFWRGVTGGLAGRSLPPGLPLNPALEKFGAQWAAFMALTTGATQFFFPRPPTSFLLEPFGIGPDSFYDTAPLLETLQELVDFDRLNSNGVHLAIGAVDVESGNFCYFDTDTTTIGPEHIMASGALPPGFPPVEIDGRHYWDGGIVSNTPLQYMLEHTGPAPMRIFQIDLFAARGDVPSTLAEADEREKDIRFSSRTRLTTDRYRELAEIRAAADRLRGKLPDYLKDDPDLQKILGAGPNGPVTLVHLIHEHQDFETSNKDYEFSRRSMERRWAEGRADVEATLNHPAWKNRGIPDDRIQIFDLAHDRNGKAVLSEVDD